MIWNNNEILRLYCGYGIAVNFAGHPHVQYVNCCIMVGHDYKPGIPPDFHDTV